MKVRIEDLKVGDCFKWESYIYRIVSLKEVKKIFPKCRIWKDAIPSISFEKDFTKLNLYWISKNRLVEKIERLSHPVDEEKHQIVKPASGKGAGVKSRNK